MASDAVNKGGQILSAALRFLRIFTLNAWRRLLMLSHYTIICFHQQRLRRACRMLGKRVLHSLAGGEVNPLLAGDVKDSLTKAQAIHKAKDKHYQANAALREKIRAAWITAAPPPPKPEPAPTKEEAPAQEEAPKEPGPEQTQG